MYSRFEDCHRVSNKETKTDALMHQLNGVQYITLHSKKGDTLHTVNEMKSQATSLPLHIARVLSRKHSTIINLH